MDGRMTLRKTISVRKTSTLFVALAVVAGFLLVPAKSLGQVLDSFLEPYEQSELATSQTGTVYKIEVKLGQSVRRGQIIASLDVRSLEASLKIALLRAKSTAEVAAAQAKQLRATQRLEKLKSVVKEGHGTQTELEQSEIELVVAQSELELAQEKHAEHEADVERIEAEIEQRITRSPFDGVITHIHRQVGEFASTNNPNLATVAHLDRLRVKFYIATVDARRLQQSQSIPVKIEGQLTDGQIEYLSPVTDPKTGAVRLDVLIDNRNAEYRSGVPCQLALENLTETNDPRSAQAGDVSDAR